MMPNYAFFLFVHCTVIRRAALKLRSFISVFLRPDVFKVKTSSTSCPGFLSVLGAADILLKVPLQRRARQLSEEN